MEVIATDNSLIHYSCESNNYQHVLETDHWAELQQNNSESHYNLPDIYGRSFLKINYGQSSPQLSTQASFNCFCGCLRYRRCLTKFLIKRNSMDATFTCISSTNSYANLSSGITLSTRLAIQFLIKMCGRPWYKM